MQSFNHAHFTLPMARSPIVTFFKIIVPNWLLGFISLVIFFQEGGKAGLGSRIPGIATIMLAYIATMPLLREEIPPAPQLTLLEISGYL